MSSAFSERDIALLDKTLSIREQLVDNLMKFELPTKARDLDAYANLLESIDRSVLGRAKVNIDNTANDNTSETNLALRSLLLELHKSNSDMREPIEGYSAPVFESKGIDISDGELIDNRDEIDYKSVLRGE